MRKTFRSARLVVHLINGLMISAALASDRKNKLPRERITRRWNRELLGILNVRVDVRGAPPAGPVLLVANHVSWLDIPVIAASVPTRFVSKAEVRDWPIAGWLATAAGTLYLKRGAGGTRELIERIQAQVESSTVTFFPEGTTTDGSSLLRFQPRLFAAALGAHCRVQPVAIRYGRAANGEDIAPFIGDATLAGNLLRLLREPELSVELTFLAPIPPQGHDRASLAQAAFAAVCGVVDPERAASNGLASTREYLAA